MLSSTTLSPRCRLYVGCVVVAGSLAIAESLYRLYVSPISYTWTVFALLTLFSGSFSIKVPSIPARISVSETFVFTAVLLFGSAPGTLIVALDGLIISLWKKKPHPHRVLFNGAEPAVSIWIAAHLFFALSGFSPLSQQRGEIQIASLVIPLLVLTVVYFLLNSWLTAVAVWLETGISAIQLWRQHFLWLSLNYFGGASVAILLARNTPDVDLSALSLIVPLLVISYLTFKTALQRVEDARSHVSQLNNLYLSTIETFAMWIDAKDQVTHGHIRRVQTYAVGLARDLGVRDEKLVKAIEAAALLHDMGKLAVPEHILNKPGKLTSGEFERMKLHASVGAQILSSIDFPYPVVPIVRHHHENWDGTGYPDRLAGTDIPIGARILSVVDCFDALTSDRPYRPRLPDQDAVAILLDRRGTMYDPLVVDAFMRVHETLANSAAEVDERESPRDGRALPPPQLDFAPTQFASNSDAVLALCELARSLAGHAGIEDTAAVIARHLKELVPVSLFVLFSYDPDRDEIMAVHASGTGADAVRGLRLRLGVGISGWVAANRQIVNDLDAGIELSKTAAPAVALLKRAHSYPLLGNDSLVGVLTLYCESTRPLPEGSLRTLALLTPHISRAMEQAKAFDKDQDRRLKDRLTGLPRFDSVAELVTNHASASMASHPLVVVFLDVDHLKSINQRFGTAVGDAVLRHVTEVVRGGLRAGDLLLRYAGDEFVVLLTESDVATAECVAQRLVGSLSGSLFHLEDGRSISIDLATAYAMAPSDGTTLEQLVTIARTRALSRTLPRQTTAVH